MNMRYAMRSEDTEQINVVSWANWNVNRYPELKWLHHVPNGGSRNKQEAAKGRERFDRNGKVYRRGKEQGEIGETVELLTGIERPRHQGGSFQETDSKSRRI